MENRLTYLLQPKGVLFRLISGVSVLAGMHLLVLAAKRLGHERLLGIVRLFDMDRERSVPTLFSANLFLISGFLFYSVWRVKKGGQDRSVMWVLMACVMAFLGIDEACQIHEYLMEPVKARIETSGFFGPAWVIPYGIAAIVLFLVVLPFLIRLEKSTRLLLIASGAVFVSGAVGIEMITGKYVEYMYEQNDGVEINMFTDLYYGLLVVVEESLEMLGLCLAIFTLLRFLQRAHGGMEVEVPPLAEAPEADPAS